MSEIKDNCETVPQNKKKVSCCIKIVPQSKRKSKRNDDLRSSSLNSNIKVNSVFKGNDSVNNMDDFELQCRNYLDDVLKINDYVKLPNSINNENDKRKWKKAHSLRNKMKEYDLMTRRRLYQSNSVSTKAKFNRERYIILNKIPRYREAFPSIMDTSNKVKEDIIRTYLKTHAAYLLSEMKRSGNSVNFQKKRNSSSAYKKSTNIEDGNYSLNYYHSDQQPGRYKSINRRETEKGYKKDLSYNLWKKIFLENIKNGKISPTTKRYLNKYGLTNYSLENYHQNNHNLRSHDLNNYNILVNGTYHNLNLNTNKRNTNINSKMNQRSISNKHLSNKNPQGNNNSNYPNKIILHNEKREDAYELKYSKNKINKNSSAPVKNYNMNNSSNEGKDIRSRDSFKTNITHNIAKTDYQNSNNNSTYSTDSVNKYSHSHGKTLYEKYRQKNENFVYKRDRFSLLGRIKNNKDIEVRLLLNKV
ncbi:conserved Plasmodium protein, unknown function [Plasmodium ovale wallikeri]|uniref:Uncharacterized protein n=2 Tax=Plasmodium ovale TaxID=36330 RepID=A0A1A9A3B2_PLAOA|nr:conserved Plasmodium protein, unknown function [Plasmodium ovale wallikeri]SBT50615.1 conserved Plasmodium protein, unknown function [Plasmodium ovale wallikeri]SBT76728.1 conserved Plasmodium protein, unknown function [Plasmodium ovale]